MTNAKESKQLNTLMDVLEEAEKEGAMGNTIQAIAAKLYPGTDDMDLYIDYVGPAHVFIDCTSSVAEEIAGVVSRQEIPFPVCKDMKQLDEKAREELHWVWRRGTPLLRYSTVERFPAEKARIYIVLREQIARFDLGHSALSIAHGMMAAAHEWRNDPYFQEWRRLSFRKYLGIANEKEWTKLKTVDAKHLVMNESGCEGNPEVSMIFEPMGGEEVPNVLKHLRPLSWDNLKRKVPDGQETTV